MFLLIIENQKSNILYVDMLYTYIPENNVCIFELRFGRPIVALRQDRRPLGYASSLSSRPRSRRIINQIPL